MVDNTNETREQRILRQLAEHKRDKVKEHIRQPWEDRKGGIMNFDDIPNTRTIFYKIADFIRTKGSYPTIVDLIRETGFTKGSVRHHIHQLVDYRFIEFTADLTPKTIGEVDIPKVYFPNSRRIKRVTLEQRIEQYNARQKFNRFKRSSRKRGKKYKTKGDSHTLDLMLMRKQQGNRCWWCGCELEEDCHVDHRVPISRGGTNDIGNLCLACPPCNLKKHDKLPHEFNGRLL